MTKIIGFASLSAQDPHKKIRFEQSQKGKRYSYQTVEFFP
jgi:hypothetical protein